MNKGRLFDSGLQLTPAEEPCTFFIVSLGGLSVFSVGPPGMKTSFSGFLSSFSSFVTVKRTSNQRRFEENRTFVSTWIRKHLWRETTYLLPLSLYRRQDVLVRRSAAGW